MMWSQNHSTYGILSPMEVMSNQLAYYTTVSFFSPLIFYFSCSSLLQFPSSSPSVFFCAAHLALLSPPRSPPHKPTLISGRGEAIYSNHRDLARAPRSPRGLIGNQRDGGYEGERERNKLYLNFRSVEQTSPIPNLKQLCHEIVV